MPSSVLGMGSPKSNGQVGGETGKSFCWPSEAILTVSLGGMKPLEVVSHNEFAEGAGFTADKGQVAELF